MVIAWCRRLSSRESSSPWLFFDVEPQQVIQHVLAIVSSKNINGIFERNYSVLTPPGYYKKIYQYNYSQRIIGVIYLKPTNSSQSGIRFHLWTVSKGPKSRVSDTVDSGHVWSKSIFEKVSDILACIFFHSTNHFATTLILTTLFKLSNIVPITSYKTNNITLVHN